MWCVFIRDTGNLPSVETKVLVERILLDTLLAFNLLGCRSILHCRAVQ